MAKIKCGEVLVIVVRASAAQFKRSFGVLCDDWWPLFCRRASWTEYGQTGLVFLFRLDLPAPRDSNISEESADEGFDDTDYLDENGKPREVRQSVGPFPNDRKFSTATQEAVYIYQASARAAGKIHDDHIKQHQQEGEN